MLCAAVKADAYGHGAAIVAPRLVDAGVGCLAVATVDEGLELRRLGLKVPVLLYGALQADEWQTAVEADLQPFLSGFLQLEQLAAAARLTGKVARVHLKVDTGMGRLGCLPDIATELAYAIVHNPWLELEGLSTHFASSESVGPISVDQQVAVFLDVRRTLEAAGHWPLWVHAANSGAILGHPEAHFNMVRPGISLYGYAPDGGPRPKGLSPVLELVSRVAFVKTVESGTQLSYGSRYTTSQRTDVATVPIGYADGYRRSFSNRAPLVIGGKQHRVSGTVCMDQFVVDLGSDSGVQEGDAVHLLGSSADGTPDADDLARLADTISYEILCGLSKRIPRIEVAP
jgi:alanine racemase